MAKLYYFKMFRIQKLDFFFLKINHFLLIISKIEDLDQLSLNTTVAFPGECSETRSGQRNKYLRQCLCFHASPTVSTKLENGKVSTTFMAHGQSLQATQTQFDIKCWFKLQLINVNDHFMNVLFQNTKHKNLFQSTKKKKLKWYLTLSS